MKIRFTHKHFYSSFFFLCTIFVMNLEFVFSNAGGVIGIDLGSEFFKAAILQPGKAFTMMENIQSKTKTPTALAFKDDERVFGADAIAKKPRFPKQVLTFFNEYLGDSYTEREINSNFQEFLDRFFIAYDFEKDTNRGTIQIKITFNKEEMILSAEELFGMLFRYIKTLADKFTQSDIRDCVVTVPNFYSYKQRLAIVQAIEMTKLNLLGIINDNIAAAIHFGQNKIFEKTEYFIFYNMGSSYTQATLASFTSNTEVRNGKTVEISKSVDILAETWNKNLGGKVLNYNLVRLLSKKFDESESRKGRQSVSKDTRVAERILPAAIKYTEILSANKEVPVTILGVDAGMNLETKLTREEFEQANYEEFSKVYDPIQTLLEKTGLGLDQISQIELIGGSVRVPRIQENLKVKLIEQGNYANLLGQHMNGDDSIALGSAFICANFTSNFKGKKVELNYKLNYQIKVSFEYICKSVEDKEIPCNVMPVNEKTILNFSSFNSTQIINVNSNQANAIKIFLFQQLEERESLILFHVLHLKEVSNSLITLKFTQNAKGLTMIDAGTTSSDINITTEYFNPKPLSNEEMLNSKNKLDKLDATDRLKIITMEKRNALESMIYSKKELLEENKYSVYAKSEELEAANQQLKEISEWYEDQGYSANFELLSLKWDLIGEIFIKFDMRIENHKNIDKAIKLFLKEKENIEKNAKETIETKPWMQDHYNHTFKNIIRDTNSWYAQFENKKTRTPLYEVKEYSLTIFKYIFNR